MHLICFPNFYSLIYLLVIITELQSYCSSEIKPRHNWHYHETSSSINDCRGQQEKSYYQPDTYNQRQQYYHDRTAEQFPSKKFHDKKCIN